MSPRAFEDSIDKAKERLRPLLRQAIRCRAFLNVDMEHHSIKSLTLALYKQLLEEDEFRGYPHTGVAVQAYLRDAEDDVTALVDWCRARRQRITIRLVKGAYWDTEVIHARQNRWPPPVFTDKHESDANFERVARLVLGNHEYLSLACGSHNIRSIAAVIETAEEMRVPQDRFEFQVLYGMAEPIRKALLDEGLRVRQYCPIGELVPGMAYLVRRLLENTSNESFLRKSFAEHASMAELLRNPTSFAEQSEPSPPAGRPSDDESSSTGTEPSKPSGFENEPLWDWSLAEHRKEFSAALREVRDSFPTKAPLFIGGKPVETEKDDPVGES